MSNTKYTARDRRNDAITAIVNNWIGQDGDEVGMLIGGLDFALLQTRVHELRDMSRSADWKKGIDKWIVCIDYAQVTFNDAYGLSKFTYPNTSDYPPYTATGRELIRLFKWAIQQGGQYAFMYNN